MILKFAKIHIIKSFANSYERSVNKNRNAILRMVLFFIFCSSRLLKRMFYSHLVSFSIKWIQKNAHRFLKMFYFESLLPLKCNRWLQLKCKMGKQNCITNGLELISLFYNIGTKLWRRNVIDVCSIITKSKSIRLILLTIFHRFKILL